MHWSSMSKQVSTLWRMSSQERPPFTLEALSSGDLQPDASEDLTSGKHDWRERLLLCLEKGDLLNDILFLLYPAVWQDGTQVFGAVLQMISSEKDERPPSSKNSFVSSKLQPLSSVSCFLCESSPLEKNPPSFPCKSDFQTELTIDELFEAPQLPCSSILIIDHHNDKELWIITLNYTVMTPVVWRLFRIWDWNEEHDGGLMNFEDGRMVGLPLGVEYVKDWLKIWVWQ